MKPPSEKKSSAVTRLAIRFSAGLPQVPCPAVWLPMRRRSQKRPNRHPQRFKDILLVFDQNMETLRRAVELAKTNRAN